jgi:hypothetical protein
MTSPESDNSFEALRRSTIDAAYALLEGLEYGHAFDPLYGEPLWKKGLVRVIKGPQLFRRKSIQLEHGFDYVDVSEDIRRRLGQDEPVALKVLGLSQDPTIGNVTIRWATDLLKPEQDVETLQLIHSLLSENEPSGDAFTELVKHIPYIEKY